jgi:hypothetical protein
VGVDPGTYSGTGGRTHRAPLKAKRTGVTSDTLSDSSVGSFRTRGVPHSLPHNGAVEIAPLRSTSELISPNDKSVPLGSPGVAVAVLVLPRHRCRQGQHRKFTLRLRGFHFRVFSN